MRISDWSSDVCSSDLGSAGLFCVAAGHGRREIAEAVNEALPTLDYAPPFQFGHPASFQVARRIALVTPADLDHLFFAHSRSEETGRACGTEIMSRSVTIPVGADLFKKTQPQII